MRARPLRPTSSSLPSVRGDRRKSAGAPIRGRLHYNSAKIVQRHVHGSPTAVPSPHARLAQLLIGLYRLSIQHLIQHLLGVDRNGPPSDQFEPVPRRSRVRTVFSISGSLTPRAMEPSPQKHHLGANVSYLRPRGLRGQGRPSRRSAIGQMPKLCRGSHLTCQMIGSVRWVIGHGGRYEYQLQCRVLASAWAVPLGSTKPCPWRVVATPSFAQRVGESRQLHVARYRLVAPRSRIRRIKAHLDELTNQGLQFGVYGSL